MILISLLTRLFKRYRQRWWAQLLGSRSIWRKNLRKGRMREGRLSMGEAQQQAAAMGVELLGRRRSWREKSSKGRIEQMSRRQAVCRGGVAADSVQYKSVMVTWHPGRGCAPRMQPYGGVCFKKGSYPKLRGLWAGHLMSVRLMGVHLMGVHLMGVHLMAVHLLDIPILGRVSVGVYFMGVQLLG
jgi:hypothetical protein